MDRSIDLYTVESACRHRHRFIVAVDTTGSTRVLTALCEARHEEVFSGWMAWCLQRLLMLECEEVCGGFEVANFTGDGFILLCETTQALWRVLSECCQLMAGELLERATQTGIDAGMLMPVRLRTAVTHGVVHEVVLKASRNADPAAMKQFMSNPYKDEGDDTLPELSREMALVRTERAHMGSAVVLACRLLDTCLSRDHFGVLIDDSAHTVLQSDPDSARRIASYSMETVDTKETSNNRVWCGSNYVWQVPSF